ARVVAEQRLADDAQREPHHLVVDVDRLPAALRELFGALLGRAYHRGSEPRDPLPVEGRLGDAPLPLPEVALGREQAVAEDVPERRVPARLLAVVLVVLGEDVVDARRRADQVRDHRPESETDYVAVLAERLREEPDRVAP